MVVELEGLVLEQVACSEQTLGVAQQRLNRAFGLTDKDLIEAANIKST